MRLVSVTILAVLIVFSGCSSDSTSETDDSTVYQSTSPVPSALKPIPPPGRRGIRNLGTTCYLNSVLQFLMHNELVRGAFSTLPVEHSVNPVMASFLRLLQSQWEDEGVRCIDPRGIFGALNAFNRDLFTPNIQQDVHEAFVAIANELVRAGGPSFDLFSFATSTALSCDNGASFNEADAQVENQLGLVLRVPRREVFADPTLEILIQAFFQPEVIPGLVACNRKAGVQRVLAVDSPRILVFTLNRNDFGEDKIDTPVSFPEEIDSGIVAGIADGIRYRLVGVLDHHGTSVRGGHYTANIQIENSWWSANDSFVTPIEGGLNRVSEKAAMFFYQAIEH